MFSFLSVRTIRSCDTVIFSHVIPFTKLSKSGTCQFSSKVFLLLSGDDSLSIVKISLDVIAPGPLAAPRHIFVKKNNPE
jgi:hypothetical protein